MNLKELKERFKFRLLDEKEIEYLFSIAESEGKATRQWSALHNQVKIWLDIAGSNVEGWDEREVKGHARAWRYVLNAMNDLEDLSTTSETAVKPIQDNMSLSEYFAVMGNKDEGEGREDNGTDKFTLRNNA